MMDYRAAVNSALHVPRLVVTPDLPQLLTQLLKQSLYLLLGDFCLLALEVGRQKVDFHFASLPEIDKGSEKEISSC